MTSPHIEWPGWETVRLIGRGSFGAVYEIQRDVFGDVEKAALKVISIPQNAGDIEEMYSDGYDDESITSTFQSHLKSIVAEYSLMRKMNGSANIVNCDDVRYIQHDDGIGWDIFIKMELLTPLTKALPIDVPEETVVQIAKDMCAALELCKRHEIVHRDIKPQNIFVSPNGDYKLGDFGIAKTVEKTMGGTKIGTYKYMAPEVYNNQPYGSAADIYSLGLVLYWMLNERRMPFLPLPPAKLKAGMDEDARHRRLAGETIPAPAHGSDELKRIVLKACEYEPKNRYESADAMLTDLRTLSKEEATILSISPTPTDAVVGQHDDITTGPVFEGKAKQDARAATANSVEDAPVTGIPASEMPVAAGTAVQMCVACGTPLEVGMAFCVECGTPVVTATAIPTVQGLASGKKAKTEKSPKSEKKSMWYKRPVPKKAVILIVIAIIVLLGGVCGFMGYHYYQMSTTYEAAVAALGNRDYDEALALFEKYDYKDSEAMADILRAQQSDYDLAINAVEAHEFNIAQSYFAMLGDYRDSIEWSEYRITYERAMYITECADNGDFEAGCNALGEIDTVAGSENSAAYLYYNAGALFSQISEYQDAAVLADDCYFNAGIHYLEDENWNNADRMQTLMSDDAKDEFRDVYISYCADGYALEIIEASLNLYNLYPEMDAAYITGIEENITALEALSSEHFHDANIQDVAVLFCSGLRMERESMDEEGYMLDETLFYEGCAVQSDAIDILVELGFKPSDESLLYSYEGMGDYYRACAAVTQDLHDQLNGQKAKLDGAIGDYLTYTNGTNYNFILDYYIEFSADNEYLGSSDQHQIEIAPGETVKIPLNVPNDIAYIWDEWTIWRDFDITDY